MRENHLKLSSTSVLRRLSAASVSIRRKPTPLNVHRFRVAAARLRVWLQMGGHRRLENELRHLRKAASAVRTLDVQLARWKRSPLRREWTKRREAERSALGARLSARRTDTFFRALAAIAPPRLHDARKATRKLASKALGWPVDWYGTRSRHALRRKLRRLRYAMEWQGLGVRRLVPLQDVLGQLNDLAEPSNEAARSERTKAVRVLERQAAPLWKSLRPRLKSLRR